MLNQFVLVGRITSDLEVNEVEEKKVAILKLAVPRSYKNSDGVYETDFIPVTLWDGIATNVSEFCKKGDLVGIKRRLQSNENEIRLIAEKVTFLSNKKED